MPEEPQAEASFGPNAWLVDDMYEQYRQDPTSVSESWREFFADYQQRGLGRRVTNGAAAARPAMSASPAPEVGEAPPAAPRR